MLSQNAAIAKEVETVMKEVYDSIGLAYHTHVTTINQQGVKLL